MIAIEAPMLLLHTVSQLVFQVYSTRHSAQSALGLIAAFGVAQRVLFVGALVCLTCAIFVGRAKTES